MESVVRSFVVEVTNRLLLVAGGGGGGGIIAGGGGGGGLVYYENKNIVSNELTTTIVFHHGNFDNSYGYSDVQTASLNGYIFADTPIGTYSWGTLSSAILTESTGNYTNFTVGNTVYTWKLNDISTISITVGAGGIGGGNINQGDNSGGKKGADSSVTGFETAVGGGPGAAYSTRASFDSSGGSTGGYKTVFVPNAITGQGNLGGVVTGTEGKGGGGAGSATTGDNGGAGANYLSIFGTTLGASGYFSGGGGGGGRNDGNSNNAPGVGGIGGGGNGDVNGNATISIGSAMNGTKHTGGGGGGGGWNGTSPSGEVGGTGGSGIAIVQVYNNAIFVRLFSDGWFTVDGPTNVALGSSFTLPVYSPSDGVTVTGTVDVNTAGTYNVTYAVEGMESVVRSFVVAVPILAFHYGNFDSSYGDASVEAAALQWRVFANTISKTYDWGTLGVVSTSGSSTTYTWTPLSEITANVLMVAGGGGGYSSVNVSEGGGGGGAGGLLFYNNQVFETTTKTISVGKGAGVAANGSSTSFTGLSTVNGGGGGGTGNGSSCCTGRTGGSGAGSVGGYNGKNGGSGTSGQGHNGANAPHGWGSGGGGAGSAGGGEGIPRNAGLGRNLSVDFGVIYGDSGWFASGGAGGINSATSASWPSSLGGGGASAGTTDGVESSVAVSGKPHTGGGGGGALNYSKGTGGSGGSGIVLVKQVQL
jgi:hypothetical protein